MSEQDTVIFLEGKISVAAALRSPYRAVHRVLVRADRQDRTVRWLQHRAREADVPVVQVDATEIDAVTQGNSHGGIAAEAGQRQFVRLEELLPRGNGPAFVVMLDGIEDPFNFGQALRALYAMGAHGVALRPRNWMSAAATVARASAGASELMPMAVAETVAEAAEFYREQGLTVACAQKENALPMDEADLTGPLFLLVGGGKTGRHPVFRQAGRPTLAGALRPVQFRTVSGHDCGGGGAGIRGNATEKACAAHGVKPAPVRFGSEHLRSNHGTRQLHESKRIRHAYR